MRFSTLLNMFSRGKLFRQCAAYTFNGVSNFFTDVFVCPDCCLLIFYLIFANLSQVTVMRN